MKTATSYGAVIFSPSRKAFLLLQHRDGIWEFPKGTPESGETPDETLFREVEEETGISQCERIDFHTSSQYTFYYKGRIRKTVHYGLLVSDQEPSISDEHQGFVWVDKDEALSRFKYRNHKRVLKKAAEALERAGFELSGSS